MNKDDAAFPTHNDRRPDDVYAWRESGMTLRTYIATAALKGMLADRTRNGTEEQYAAGAVSYADALIAELNKP